MVTFLVYIFLNEHANYFEIETETASIEKALLFHTLFFFPGTLFAKLKAKQMTARMRVWSKINRRKKEFYTFSFICS